MSEHKRKAMAKAESSPTQTAPAEVSNIDEGDAKILAERYRNAHPGFFLRAATWILSRFPLTQNRYQNWTPTKRVIVGWLCWLIVLPIIPIAVTVIWYVKDPAGFKKSPWAKVLIGLAVLWAGYAGAVVTNPSQADINGRYSPVQTAPNGEVKGTATGVNTPTEAAKAKVAKQSVSNPSNGRKFTNCTEAFDAGVFNIKRSDSSYQPKLDRDSDGIACEK